VKKLILVTALAFLLGLPALTYGQAKVGTSGAQFLEIGVSSRAIGMGEAFVGLADDASALYYNPGGTALFENYEIMYTHVDYPADIQYEFIGAVLPTPQFYGNLGFAAYWLHTGDMNVTSYAHPEGNGQTFSAGDLALGATYAPSLTDHFSIGLTLKYIHSFLEVETASGWALDVGTYYNSGYRNFTICMMIANFGPDMKFIRETYPLPIDFRFGTAINVIEGENNKLTWSVQASRPSDNLEKFNTGLEYWFNDMFALRAGKKFQYDYFDSGILPQNLEDTSPFDGRKKFNLTSGFTFGFGVRVPVSTANMQIDYAYQDMGFLDTVHRFSFDIKF
jgi:hypothetical protein